MRRDASGGVKQLRGGLPFPSLRTRSRTFLRPPSLCRCSPVTLYAASSAFPAATNRASCCSQRPRRQSSTSYMSRRVAEEGCQCEKVAVTKAEKAGVHVRFDSGRGVLHLWRHVVASACIPRLLRALPAEPCRAAAVRQ